MNAFHRIALGTLTLAAFAAAHAGEVTEFPLAKSVLSRAEVQAEARQARPGPGELYDGTQAQARMPQAAAPTREEVRMQARSAPMRSDDYLGG